MGVGGNFWDFLKPYARNEGFDFLRNKRVAVDLSFWIVQHENAIKGFARKPHIRLTFFRTIHLFSKFGAFPVFVLDGTPSPLKSQARIARFYRLSGIELPSLREAGEGISVERNHAFTKCVHECVELLELLGMPVLRAKGEAEALCAQLDHEGQVDACITTDSDAFLFGAKCVIKCIRPNCSEPFECYHLSDIEAGLGLKRKHFIAISLLVGNDHDLAGVPGIGLETALRFVQNYSEEDVLNRLCEIGKGDTSCSGIKPIVDPDETSPTIKQSHCSFCGHPGSKSAHIKIPCRYCKVETNAGCVKKPKGFRCDCCSCDRISKLKEQKKQENWQIKICSKIATQQNFPNDKLIEMYLCNDNAKEEPCISWGSPNTEMLVDFLSFHQNWEPSYIRKRLFPILSTLFLRANGTKSVKNSLLEQYEFDSVKRVKVRYGHQFYVVKWKHARGSVTRGIPSMKSPGQHEDVEESDLFEDFSGVDEAGNELYECDVPETFVDEEDIFLLTDENMDLLNAAFPEAVDKFWQEQELKELKRKKKSRCESEGKSKRGCTQLNITEFYPVTKVGCQSKLENQLVTSADSHGDKTSPKAKTKVSSQLAMSADNHADDTSSKAKTKVTSPNLPKSVRRRLLFD